MCIGVFCYLSGYYFFDYDDCGMLCGYFFVLQDLMVCMSVELVLGCSEWVFKFVFDNVLLLVLYIDFDGVFIFCNVMYVCWLQCMFEEVCGQILEWVFMLGMYVLLVLYLVCVQCGEFV